MQRYTNVIMQPVHDPAAIALVKVTSLRVGHARGMVVGEGCSYYDTFLSWTVLGMTF